MRPASNLAGSRFEIWQGTIMNIRSLFCEQAPRPVGPYSQAVEASPFIFISGQIPLDPQTGEVVGQTTAEQALRSLKNINAILAAAGLDFSRLVKVTVFLRHMADFAQFNEVYQKELGGAAPARSVVEVSSLPKGVLVEIEAVACR